MLLLLLPSLGQAALEDWHPTNQKLFKSYIVLNAVDVLQTFDLIDCQDNLAEQCPYAEGNRFVGTHPKKSEIILIKALSVYGAYALLDSQHKFLWPKDNTKAKFIALSIMNMIYIDTVYNNHSIGLKMSYQFNF